METTIDFRSSNSTILTSTNIYRSLRQIFRVQSGDPLRLDRAKYEGAQELFTQHEVPRLLKIQNSTKPSKMGGAAFDPTISLDTIRKMELLRYQMHITLDPETYDKIRGKFDAIVTRVC